MEIKYDKPRLWKKIIRGALDVLAAVLLLLSIVVSMLVHGVLNSENCKNAICNQEFDEAVKQAIIKNIESSSSVIELDSQKLFEEVKIDALVSYAREYTSDFINSMFSSKEFEPKSFDNQAYRQAVIYQLKQNADELTDDEINEIADEAMENIQSTLQYVPVIITNMVGKISVVLEKLLVLKKLEIPMYIFTLIVVIANFIFGGKNHRLNVFYGTSASIWIAFATVLIPLIMLAIYDIPSKIALGESLLLYFVIGLNRVFIINSAKVLGFVLILITVALAWSIILIAKRKVEQSKKEEHYIRNHKKTVDKTVQ